MKNNLKHTQGIKFDWDKDTLLDLHNRQSAIANGGRYTPGGYDMPVAAMLSKTTKEKADYTIRFDRMCDEKVLSGDPRLVPNIMREEPIPFSSTPAVSHPFDNYLCDSLFTKAMKAHVKLVSLLKASGSNTADIERAFKQQWGIDLATDLHALMPSVRSGDSVAWAGVDRKLVPAFLANTGALAQTHILDHQKPREEMGQGKLVDWPRAKTVLMGVQAQIIQDDRVARKMDTIEDMHFKIQRGNIPDAPVVKCDIVIDDIKRERCEAINREVKTMLQEVNRQSYIHGCKDEEIEIEPLMGTDINNTVRSIPKGLVLMEKPDSFSVVTNQLGFLDPKVDDDDQPVNFDQKAVINIMQKSKRYLDPTMYIKMMAHRYVDIKKGMHIKPYEIRKMIVALDENYNKARQQLVDVFKEVYPKDMMLRLYHIGNFVEKGIGLAWVNRFKKTLKLRHFQFTQSDMVAQWERIIAYRDSIVSLAEITAQGIAQRANAAASSVFISDKIREWLTHPTSLIRGLSLLVKQRKVYWHNRYKERAKNDELRRVERQLFSTAMKAVRLKMTNQFMIEPVYYGVKKAFILAATNYVRKRNEEFYMYSIQVSLFNCEFEIFGMQLDEEIQRIMGEYPKLKFQNVCRDFQHEMQLFVDDFRDFIADYISTGEVREHLDHIDDMEYIEQDQEKLQLREEMKKANLYDHESTRQYEQLQKEKIMAANKVQVPIIVEDQLLHLGEQVVDQEGEKEQAVDQCDVVNTNVVCDDQFGDIGGGWDDFGGFGDFDIGALDRVQDQRISLRQALIDENFTIDEPVMQQLLKTYPEMVECDVVKEVRDKYIKLMYKQ